MTVTSTFDPAIPAPEMTPHWTLGGTLIDMEARTLKRPSNHGPCAFKSGVQSSLQ